MEDEEEVMTADELSRIINSAIQNQMPRLIIEASKVARENLAQERDEAQNALKAEVKKLKQSHAELELSSKANALKTEGNKSQYNHLAATKSKIDAALLMLDDLQLNEPDCDTPTYTAISSIKERLEGAVALIEGRFNLIHKVDSSKIGWSAVPHYKKANGYLVTPESGKNWEAAEKKVSEARKASEKEKEKKPFRSWPASGGRYQNYSKSTSRGEQLSLCIFSCSDVVLFALCSLFALLA